MSIESKNLSDERLGAFLKTHAPTPPPAPATEYARLCKKIETCSAKSWQVRLRRWGLVLSSVLAILTLVAVGIYQYRSYVIETVTVETIAELPSSLLLLNSDLTEEEFRSPVEDWNIFAEAVTVQSM